MISKKLIKKMSLMVLVGMSMPMAAIDFSRAAKVAGEGLLVLMAFSNFLDEMLTSSQAQNEMTVTRKATLELEEDIALLRALIPQYQPMAYNSHNAQRAGVHTCRDLNLAIAPIESASLNDRLKKYLGKFLDAEKKQFTLLQKLRQEERGSFPGSQVNESYQLRLDASKTEYENQSKQLLNIRKSLLSHAQKLLAERTEQLTRLQAKFPRFERALNNAIIVGRTIATCGALLGINRLVRPWLHNNKGFDIFCALGAGLSMAHGYFSLANEPEVKKKKKVHFAPKKTIHMIPARSQTQPVDLKQAPVASPEQKAATQAPAAESHGISSLEEFVARYEIKAYDSQKPREAQKSEVLDASNNLSFFFINDWEVLKALLPQEAHAMVTAHQAKQELFLSNKHDSATYMEFLESRAACINKLKEYIGHLKSLQYPAQEEVESID